MALFTSNERRVLRKFKDGAVVSEGDARILNKYASIGFVKFGFNWNEMEETARLTRSGIKHLSK
jgi:transposase